MKTVTLYADWDPKPDFKLGTKDIDGKLSYLGSKVWRNPRLQMINKPIPEPAPGQVIVKVKACGICGSDVHMAQAKPDGYIFYPGLTAFPCTLGHELSGVVVEAAADAINRRTNLPFEVGDLRRGNGLVWHLSPLCGRISQPLRTSSGNRFFHRWCFCGLYCAGCKVLLEPARTRGAL
jgi:(R,R)-butanediol dehydrogenase/meso-butanediol dehydrogenase/diacetyl reductase